VGRDASRRTPPASRRTRPIDVAIAAHLTGAIVLSIALAREPDTVAPDALAYALGVSIGVLAVFRRRSPLPVLIGSTVALQAYYLLDHPGITPALPLSVALASASAEGDRRWSYSIAGWFVVSPILYLTLVEDRAFLPVLRDATQEAALLAAVLLLGEAISDRRALAREQRLLEAERERSEQLLLNILPASVASRLKTARDPIADRFPEATVLFADIVDFTSQSAALPPERIVASLNELFSEFDTLTRERGLEKVKTIGDAYMVVGGLPEPRPDHVEAVADLALRMLDAVTRHDGPDGTPVRVRIGIDTGPVVAGVIGHDKFAWDLWGDTVNTASRMESTGVAGRIQITEAVHERLRDAYEFEQRGPIHVKGKGLLVTYFLLGRREQRRRDLASAEAS
jgi:class 3 adenylate cyclase